MEKQEVAVKGIDEMGEVEFDLQDHKVWLIGKVEELKELKEFYENLEGFQQQPRYNTLLSFFNLKQGAEISDKIISLGNILKTEFAESFKKTSQIPTDIKGKDFFLFQVNLKDNLKIDRTDILEALSKAMIYKHKSFVKFDKKAKAEIDITYCLSKDIETSENADNILDSIRGELCTTLGFSGIFPQRSGAYVQKEVVEKEHLNYTDMSPHVIVLISWNI